MNKEERDNLIDGFFNKGYACDLDEVYQAVIGTIKDLEEANDKKVEEIERLNNIINELEKWLEDNLGNCRTNTSYTSNQVYNLKEDTYYRCLDKLKELKEGKE